MENFFGLAEKKKFPKSFMKFILEKILLYDLKA